MSRILIRYCFIFVVLSAGAMDKPETPVDQTQAVSTTVTPVVAPEVVSANLEHGQSSIPGDVPVVAPEVVRQPASEAVGQPLPQVTTAGAHVLPEISVQAAPSATVPSAPMRVAQNSGLISSAWHYVKGSALGWFERNKQQMFDSMVISAFAGIFPQVVRPICGLASRGVQAAMRIPHRMHIAEYAESLRNDAEAVSQAVGWGAVAGVVEYGVRRGNSLLAQKGIDKQFPRVTTGLSVGLRTAGFGACLYKAITGPGSYLRKRLKQGRVVQTVQRELADSAPCVDGIALPTFLSEYAVRLKTQDCADGDLARTGASLLVTGNADMAHKKTLINRFARAVGDKVPVYYITYECMRAAVERGENAHWMLYHLNAEIIDQAMSYDMPLVIICLQDLEKWMADDAHIGSSVLVKELAHQSMFKAQQVHALRAITRELGEHDRRGRHVRPMFDEEGESRGYHDSTHRALGAARKFFGGDDHYSRALINQAFSIAYSEFSAEMDQLDLRQAGINCLLVGLGGAQTNYEDFDALRATCTTYDGRPMPMFTFGITCDDQGGISAQHTPMGLAYPAEMEPRRDHEERRERHRDTGDDERGGSARARREEPVKKSAVYSSEVPSQTLDTWPGSHPRAFDHLLDQFTHPEKYILLRLTGEMASSQRLLLYGAPGTGKTKLVRALAGSLGAPIIGINVGELQGADDISRAFEQAIDIARRVSAGRVILFIDDIDFMCGRREDATQAEKKVLWRVLDQLDGFARSSDRVVLIATSNTPPDKLDYALVRPGRFTWHIELTSPNAADRHEIIAYYVDILRRTAEREGDSVHGIRLAERDIDALVEHTAGYTPADLQVLISQAARLAAFAGSPLTDEHLGQAWQMLQDQRMHLHADGDRASSSTSAVRVSVMRTVEQQAIMVQEEERTYHKKKRRGGKKYE